VLFLVGNNPYESQSVFFMQRMTGKRIIVLDPRRTITADYAQKTGGLHLRPAVLGADVAIINAMCRRIRDLRQAAPNDWGQARFDAVKPRLVEKKLFMDQLRAKWASTDSRLKGPDDPRRARMRLSADEFLGEFLDSQPDDLDALGVGIPKEDLEQAIRWMTGRPTAGEEALLAGLVPRTVRRVVEAGEGNGAGVGALDLDRCGRSAPAYPVPSDRTSPPRPPAGPETERLACFGNTRQPPRGYKLWGIEADCDRGLRTARTPVRGRSRKEPIHGESRQRNPGQR
jgi:hypothetical protein